MPPTVLLRWTLLLVLPLAINCVAGFSPASAEDAPGKLSAGHLRCEYLADPLGIDQTAPRLSWQVVSDQPAQRQTAYQVLVASSREKLAAGGGDLWDSGKVADSRTVNVVYGGRPLGSGGQCFWKVRVWDAEGRAGGYSAPARWSMGLLKADDWKARWISFRDESPLEASQQKVVLPPPHYYRKNYALDKPVRRATVYASALGIYQLHLNGHRVGRRLFTPGWCDYKKRCYYNTFDVTDLVNQGDNTIGAIVADGWYAGYVGYGLLVGYGPNKCGRYFYGKTPALRVQLEIEYADGSRRVVATDPSWKVATGPIRAADMLMGESYDARLEHPGWAAPAPDDGGWHGAIAADENGSTKATFFDTAGPREVELGFQPPPRMQAYMGVPIRATEEIKPVEITEPSPGVFIFNLGQNIAGVVRLKCKGPAGTRIKIRHGEMLHSDGRLMTENLRRARATDGYILRGDPEGETWTPQFTYHGFQYVELTGYPGRPGLDAVTGVVLGSDTPLASSFECSDPMVNRLFRNVVWTQRANFFEVPTDCPQRDERLGWMGDAQIYIRTATYNADVAAFFTKWLDDLEEAQRPSGAYPDYAPYPMQHGGRGKAFASAWMDAGIICPWTIYHVYGDRRVIRRHYDSMKRFMDFRRRNSPDGLGVAVGNGWGDWLALGQETPVEYVDTIYFAYTAKLMAEMAAAIGQKEDAADYRDLLARIRAAFAKKYLQPDGTLTVDTQTAYATALWVGLVPADRQRQAADRLEQLIAANGGRMATGFLGTRPLLPVLSAAGKNDLAVRLLQSREYPSWGYEVANGATTIWERWNSFTRDKGLHNPSMNSFSHYAFGAVCQWMFETLAGIDTDGPGFGRIVIRPSPPSPGSNPDHPPIHWVRARYDSIHGPVTSAWRRDGDRFVLEVGIPANTTATVFVPARDAADVSEGGRPAAKAEGVTPAGHRDGRAIFKIASGSYRFVSTSP